MKKFMKTYNLLLKCWLIIDDNNLNNKEKKKKMRKIIGRRRWIKKMKLQTHYQK